MIRALSDAIASPETLLDLPDAEMAVICKAISPSRVSYSIGGSAKRIAADAARYCVDGEMDRLTPKMRNAAIRIAYRYRRQMPNTVIALLSRWSADVFKFGVRP